MWELHRATGLGALAFLTFSALTGIAMAYPQTVRQGLDWITGSQPAMKPKRARSSGGDQQLRPLDDYVTAAAAAIPGGHVRELRLPEAGPVQVRVWTSSDLSPSGSNHVALDAASLAVISVTKASDGSIAARINQSLKPLHYAEWGGLTVRLLWFIAGLMPSVLFISGTMLWWLRRKPRRT